MKVFLIALCMVIIMPVLAQTEKEFYAMLSLSSKTHQKVVFTHDNLYNEVNVYQSIIKSPEFVVTLFHVYLEGLIVVAESKWLFINFQFDFIGNEFKTICLVW